MTSTSDWCELYRSDDLLDARAVATSIAGMEFDVRIRGLGGPAEAHAEGVPSEPQGFGAADRPPYVIEVPRDDLPALQDVLDEILAEQMEFDARLQRRYDRRYNLLLKISILVVLGAIAAAAASLLASEPQNRTSHQPLCTVP